MPCRNFRSISFVHVKPVMETQLQRHILFNEVLGVKMFCERINQLTPIFCCIKHFLTQLLQHLDRYFCLNSI